MEKLRIRLPDNWHAHLRQDVLLAAIARLFNIYGRVLCMGNTTPLIETPEQALDYRREILSQGMLFQPVMCIMLTQDTTPALVWKARNKGIRFVKFIPVGTSTGASKGLRLDDYGRLYPIFQAIVAAGMHLLIHAELISYPDGKAIDFIDREEAALEIVAIYRRDFPTMLITIEHASTAAMINFVRLQNPAFMRATLTPQHAILKYEDVFDKEGRYINPFNFCLPVAKREHDIEAVRKAMASGDVHFFGGSDSACHWLTDKLRDNPKPGIFFGEAELPLYVEIFAEEGALFRLNSFCSETGAKYYGYPLNKATLTLVREDWVSPSACMDGKIKFSSGGRAMKWKVEKVSS